MKNYEIIDAIDFLERHRIILSVDKKASKFGALLEDVLDKLEGDISSTRDEFKILFNKILLKSKNILF